MDDLISAYVNRDITSQQILISFKNNQLFAEHFPGCPTLPGALTISIIMNYACQFFDENQLPDYSLDRIERVSFIKRIDPAGRYIFKLAYKIEDKQNIRLVFIVTNDGDNKIEYARGVLVYRKTGRV